MGLDRPIRIPDLWSWSLDHIPVPETVFSAVVSSSVYQALNLWERRSRSFSSNPKGVDAPPVEK